MNSARGFAGTAFRRRTVAVSAVATGAIGLEIGVSAHSTLSVLIRVSTPLKAGALSCYSVWLIDNFVNRYSQ
jgi:hypothetical protein